MGPVLQVCESRTVAADRLWMSLQYGQDTTCFHLTWMPDQDKVEQVLVDIEASRNEGPAGCDQPVLAAEVEQCS
jgi:xylitol oxidase